MSSFPLYLSVLLDKRREIKVKITKNKNRKADERKFANHLPDGKIFTVHEHLNCPRFFTKRQKLYIEDKLLESLTHKISKAT